MARKSSTKVLRTRTRAPAPPRVDHLKPARFQDYLTLGELSYHVGKDKDWLRKLERRGTIPEGVRHRLGQNEVRLYSPSRVREIESILKTLRPGRPRKSGG